jgi:PAS domain S-box-containing protein
MDRIENYEQILDNVATGIFAVDMNWTITFFNHEAEKITGYAKEEALGRKCYEVFRAELCQEGCYLKQAMATGTKLIKVRNRILNKDNQEIPVAITVSLLQNKHGLIIGGVESFIDDSVRVILEKEIEESYSFHDIVGKDEQILSLFNLVSIVAPSDANVLILGETGCGKDLFARAIHNTSLRKDGPFIKVNCPALPDNLLESELFGYVKGAFTDAKQSKQGRFQMADGGTIFLDEIGDLSQELQAKLFQVLDEKQFYPLGATEPVRVDVRIISSTNRNLTRLVQAEKFREDFYYRLKVVEVKIPPLRKRPSDIPMLINHFLTNQARILGRQSFTLSNDALKILANYHFPGNVRELKHIIEHVTILSQTDRIDFLDLPEYLRKRAAHTHPIPLIRPLPSMLNSGLHNEKEIIVEALSAHGWHRKNTAKALHIDRTTLWRKMKTHDLLRKKP